MTQSTPNTRGHSASFLDDPDAAQFGSAVAGFTTATGTRPLAESGALSQPESRQPPLPVILPSLTPHAGPPVVTLLSDLLLVLVLGVGETLPTGSEMSLNRSLKGPFVVKKSTKSAGVPPVAPSPVIPATTPPPAKPPQVDFARRRVNRELPTESVIQLLEKEAPGFFNMCEVVGQWVWIQFREKQPRKVTAVLAELGFHWNNKRQAWQHPCGTVAPRSPRDPREKYQSYFPADAKAA